MYLALHTADKRTNDDNVRYWGGDDQPAAVGKKGAREIFSALSSCENVGEEKQASRVWVKGKAASSKKKIWKTFIPLVSCRCYWLFLSQYINIKLLNKHKHSFTSLARLRSHSSSFFFLFSIFRCLKKVTFQFPPSGSPTSFNWKESSSSMRVSEWWESS